MSISKNTREKDEYLDKTIKQLLNIKDANIRFSKEAVSKEKVNGRMANIFTGILTYKVDRCPSVALRTSFVIPTKTVGSN